MPAFFIPARDSRHRTACFALYKALLRQGARVPLPNDLKVALGPVNPIKHLVRKGFRRNKNDTSPRLVVSALQNGYKFLSLLSQAQDRSSAQHASVLAFLRVNQSYLLARRAAAATKLPPSTAPRLGSIPLLTRTGTSAAGIPVYTSTLRPRPLEQLGGSGVRQVPRIDDAGGVPFLRFTKPPSPAHERVLRQKYRRRQVRVARLLDLLQGDMFTNAMWEDEWDAEMEMLLAEQQQGIAGKQQTGPDRQVQGSRQHQHRHQHPVQRKREAMVRWNVDSTFLGSVRVAAVELAASLNAEKVDMMARGKALWKIVEEEAALAEKEKKDRQQQRQISPRNDA